MPATLLESEPAVPLHGFRGDRQPYESNELRGLTIAISREAGARGNVIAKRVAQQLGWQLFDQDLLAYLVQNEPARQELLAEVPRGVIEWAEERHRRFLEQRRGAEFPEMHDWLKLLFVIGARGESVILGRGAGFLLPVASTLNVRIVAPFEERVAYMSQLLRLPSASAREEVQARDRLRAELHKSVSGRDAGDLTQYDLVLNSYRMGESACSDLIAEAIRAKQLPDGSDSTSDELAVV
jgi:cytidylate kinase